DDQFAGRKAELGPLDLGGGQAADEVGQGDVGVGLAHRLAGRAGQVGPADPGEETGKGAVAEQLAGVFPLVVAALGQLVEGPAAPSGGEDELLQELTPTGAAGPLAEQTTVEMTEDGPFGVGALTAGAELNHIGRASW